MYKNSTTSTISGGYRDTQICSRFQISYLWCFKEWVMVRFQAHWSQWKDSFHWSWGVLQEIHPDTATRFLMAVQRTLYIFMDSACELWEIKTKNDFWCTRASRESAQPNSKSFLVYHPSFFLPWNAQSKNIYCMPEKNWSWPMYLPMNAYIFLLLN